MDDLIFTKSKEDMKKRFSSGFASFMTRKKYNPKQIAEVLGVSESAVNGWKYGRSFPDVPNLLRLIELGLTFEEMIKINALMVIETISAREYDIYKREKIVQFLKSQMGNETNPKEIKKYEKSVEENQEIIKRLKIELEEYKKAVAGMIELDKDKLL